MRQIVDQKKMALPGWHSASALLCQFEAKDLSHLWAWKVTAQNSRRDLLKHMAVGTKNCLFLPNPRGRNMYYIFIASSENGHQLQDGYSVDSIPSHNRYTRNEPSIFCLFHTETPPLSCGSLNQLYTFFDTGKEENCMTSHRYLLFRYLPSVYYAAFSFN